MSSTFDSLDDLFKATYAEAIKKLIPYRLLNTKRINPGISVDYMANIRTGDRYFFYYIDGIRVTRQEAKDHLDLHRTKLADLL